MCKTLPAPWTRARRCPVCHRGSGCFLAAPPIRPHRVRPGQQRRADRRRGWLHAATARPHVDTLAHEPCPVERGRHEPSILDYLRALYPRHARRTVGVHQEARLPRFGVTANLDAYARQIEPWTPPRRLLTINSLDGRSIRRRGPYTRGEESEVAAVVALVARR